MGKGNRQVVKNSLQVVLLKLKVVINGVHVVIIKYGSLSSFASCYEIKGCCYVQFLTCCVYKTLSYNHCVTHFDKSCTRCVEKELRSVYYPDRCCQCLSHCADNFS